MQVGTNLLGPQISLQNFHNLIVIFFYYKLHEDKLGHISYMLLKVHNHFLTFSLHLKKPSLSKKGNKNLFYTSINWHHWILSCIDLLQQAEIM